MIAAEEWTRHPRNFVPRHHKTRMLIGNRFSRVLCSNRTQESALMPVVDTVDYRRSTDESRSSAFPRPHAPQPSTRGSHKETRKESRRENQPPCPCKGAG